MGARRADVVGGFPPAGGTHAKASAGIDEHFRMCLCAKLMAAERTRAVCDGLTAALHTYGAPGQILTENAKVFADGSPTRRWRYCLTGSAAKTASSTC